MSGKNVWGLSLLVALATAAATALAAESSWQVGMDFTTEGDANLWGGTRRAATLHSMALARIEWLQPENPDRTTTFHAYASVLNLAGRGPSERCLGDFLAASSTEGHPGTRLYSWWLEAHHRGWSLRAGALLADEEFVSTETGGVLFNSAFGWPAFISANTANTGPAFYVPALGARLERPLGSALAWRTGIYDGDTFDSGAADPSASRSGTHYQLGGAQGWFALSEVAFSPDGDVSRFKVGGWLHTAKFPDASVDDSGRCLALSGAAPRLHPRNYGLYAIAERSLAGKPGEAGHATAYCRAGASPADRNTLRFALDSGIAFTGLIPGRAADVTALGLVHAAFSSRYAAHARQLDPTAPSPDYEQVVELSHNLALTERFSVQPDLQYIRHPGGSAAQRDALAALLRVKASF